MLYSPIAEKANTGAETTHRATIRAAKQRREITGHKLARMLAGKTKAQRALVLEDLQRRGFSLTKLTAKQWAAIGELSVVMLHAAGKLDHVERAEVHDGLRPLLQAKVKPSPFTAQVSERFEVAKELVAEYGPAFVFDEIICPTLG